MPSSSPSPDPSHGIYVHAPWCRVHCPYCAFVVAVEAAPPWAAWLAAVLRDHHRQAPHFSGPAATLYLGGGTPSLIPDDVLAALLAQLPRRPDAEVTLEVNPGTTDATRLRRAVALGVTRLSVGVQTFARHHAKALARGHDVEQARGLLRSLVELDLDSWSLDLMFALPGQELDELDADLDEVISLQPPHVSLYGLTFEPGTPLTRRRDRGRLQETDERLWRRMYDRISQRLRDAGLERYEVSNFARPGHRARHNEAIWRGGFYSGLGPGAHGHLPPTPAAPFGQRTVMCADIKGWLSDSPAELERLDAQTSATDHLLSSLRHIDGTTRDALAQRGLRLDPAVLGALVAAGVLVADEESVRLTEAGVPLADGVTARLAHSLVQF